MKILKKILICAYDLDLGGIEKSLINLLKQLSLKYKITLLLQHKRGIFLNEVPQDINIIDYNLSENKNIIIRKIINRLKLMKFIFKYKNQFDTSICYATYDYPSSIICRNLCKKSILWVHTNYKNLFKNDLQKFTNFFNKRKVCKFQKIVFVSNEAEEDFLKIYPNLEDKSIVINNLIDGEEILRKSKDKINDKSNNKIITFVGRLEEESKGLYLLFDVAKELKEKVFWIVGDGPDKNNYEKYLKNNNIYNVNLLGKKNNPYPYINASDLIILPSKYEGFPVVVLESLILNKKILSNIKVSSNNFRLEDYIYLTKRSKNIIIKDILKVLDSGIKEKFDYINFNNENLNLICSVLEEKQ